MSARSASVLALLATAAVTAHAAGPVRTPATYALKDTQNSQRVTQITLDNTYTWDADSFVRTTFDNRPDSLGRGNPTFAFTHRNGALLSQMDFAATRVSNGANGTMTFRRNGSNTATIQNQSASADANGTTFLGYNFTDNQITANLAFWAARSGYNDVLRSGGYYGAGGFFAVPDEYRTGGFSGGLTSFRFESNQDVGTARMLYNFANDGGESGAVRARLLYLDRDGADGYNKIRFTYVSNPLGPVSPN